MGEYKRRSKKHWHKGPKKIVLPYSPSVLQAGIHQDPHRFRVLDCGRRFGKTWFLVMECSQMGMDVYMTQGRRARIWIVAPTFPLVKETWRVANELLAGVTTDKRETDLWIETPWYEMEFKSAERGDEGLRGAGLDAVGVDEAARVAKEAWEYGLRPALADRRGRAVFISTPKGQNWFYEMYLEGKQESQSVKSWKFSTIEGWRALYKDNPEKMIEMEEEWKVICDKTPELILKQEYMAEFLEDESTVFHRLKQCIQGQFEPPIPSEQYVIGCDLARTTDFSVLTVMRLFDNQVVYVDRFKEVSWAFQKMKIKALHQQYNGAKVMVDSTGLGDPIVEDLRRDGVYVEGYKIDSSVPKQELVEELMLVIEQGAVRIPEEAYDTIYELKTFEYEIMGKSGRIRYSAPEGKHDDCVISLALAVMGARHMIFVQRPSPVIVDTKESAMRDIHGGAKDFLKKHPNLIAMGIDRHGARRMLALRGR